MDKVFTILLAEDEPSTRNGINNILASYFSVNVAVVQASNGAEALALYKKHRPNMIITDIVMPVMTGIELIAEVRKIDENIPIILLSGYNDFEYARKAIRYSVKNYFLKPIKKDELIHEVEDVISKCREQRNFTSANFDQFMKSTESLFVRRLLLGEIVSEEEIVRTLNALNITFNGNTFTVSIVYTEDSPEDFLSSIEEKFPSSVYLMQMLDNRLILLINEDELQSRHQLKIMIDSYKQKGKTLRCVQGKTVTSLLDINSSYQTALLASSYSIYFDSWEYLDQSIITDTSPTISSSDIDTEKLKTLLLSGSDEEVLNWIDMFFNKLFYIPNPPPSYIKGMSIFLVSDIQRQLSTMESIKKEYLPQINTMLLNNISSIGDVKDWTKKYLLSIKNESIPNSMIANNQIIHQTMLYVEKNMDKMISASDLAQQFNMNPSYFSTYFKMKTDMTFRDYLAQKKNEYALELLSDPELLIDDVSNMLGYSDSRSFIRVFKNMNGITPHAYRKKRKK